MRRTPVLAAVVLALCALAIPARAHPPQGGRVMFATGNPAIAKAEYNNFNSNGVTGFTFRLGNGSDDKPYTLTALNGLTGGEDFDAWFFEDERGKPGDICTTWDARQNRAVETGRICPNDQVAGWAIVVLFTGANGQFVFEY